MTPPLELDDAQVRAVSFEARALVAPFGTVTDADDDLAAILGIRGSGRDLVGDRLFTHVALDDRDRLRRLLAGQEQTLTFPLRLRARDGRETHVIATLQRPSAEHAERLFSVVAVDNAAHLRERARDLARLSASQQAVIETLNGILTPVLQRTAGLSVASRHVPFEAESPTSGDACDVLALAGDTSHVALVDATGHGVARTARALCTIHTLRVLAIEGGALDELLPRATHLLQVQDPDLTATCVVGRFDAASGSLDLVGAGAPPAVVCRRDGSVEVVELPGSPLGFAVGRRPAVVRIDLDDGDRVLLCTDGVIGPLSFDDLVGHLRELHTSAERLDLDDLLGQVMADAVPDVAADDATILGLERQLDRADAVGPGMGLDAGLDPGFEVQLAPRLADLAPARLRLRRWLDPQELPLDVRDDVLLVMSELAANAMRVARRWVTVRVECEADAVVVSVRDDGAGLPPSARATLHHAGDVLDRTRGLFLVAEISDDVFVASDATGTLIRARCRLEPTG